MRYRWEERAAERATGLLGTWIVVSNSIVIKNPVGEQADDGDLYTCMVMGPTDPERETYRFRPSSGGRRPLTGRA